ncbi:MAG: ABC transporter permease [Acidobacteria bacterium]|nr:MAG: ABC transporter permease [Acidobacteriota bacterium]
MQTFGQDLRYGLRMLRSNPGFTLAALLTLALGISVNTTMFSLVNGVLLQPLGYADSGRLVAVFENEYLLGEPHNPASPANFLDWQSQNHVLEDMTAAHPWSPVLTGRDRPDQIAGLKSSASLFDLLGVPAAHGRTFVHQDGEPGQPPVVVLGHALWQQRFGADPGLVGQSLTLDGADFEVVGIMPVGFEFPPFWATGAQLWTPLVLDAEQAELRGARFLRVFARLRPGVSLEQARSEMTTIAQRLEQSYPDKNTGAGITVEPLQEPVVAGVRPAMLVLMGAVGFVLLIACTNVAGLLLARAASRRNEMAVRMALGASRLRIVRQLLTESILLALVGGTAGVLLSVWGVEFLVALSPENIPRIGEIHVDGRVLGFGLALSLLTGIGFGLVPAWQASRCEINVSLGQGSQRWGTARRGRLRSFLVVAEVALSLVLLLGAGLMIRSFASLQAFDPGFATSQVITASLPLAGSRHVEPQQQNLLFDQVLERLRSTPGVEAAGLINHLPVAGDQWRTRFVAEGLPVPAEVDIPRAVYRVVTPGYFDAMRIPLLRGRVFSRRDRADSNLVIIINEVLATRFWPGQDPLGRRLKVGRPDSDDPWRTVVGVVGNTRQQHLTGEVQPEWFFPYTQNLYPDYLNTSLVVRSQAAAGSGAQLVRDAVWSVDPSLPVADVRTVEQILGAAVSQPRFNTWLLGLFAGLALVLSVVGLYGVVSYMVSCRAREIGVRVALGAQRRDILRLVLGQGMSLALVGILVGLAAGLALVRLLAGLLFQISPTDPVTFVGIPLLLALVSLLACYIPARRAAGAEPLAVLRQD